MAHDVLGVFDPPKLTRIRTLLLVGVLRGRKLTQGEENLYQF